MSKACSYTVPHVQQNHLRFWHKKHCSCGCVCLGQVWRLCFGACQHVWFASSSSVGEVSIVSACLWSCSPLWLAPISFGTCHETNHLHLESDTTFAQNATQDTQELGLSGFWWFPYMDPYDMIWCYFLMFHLDRPSARVRKRCTTSSSAASSRAKALSAASEVKQAPAKQLGITKPWESTCGSIPTFLRSALCFFVFFFCFCKLDEFS